MRKIKYKLLTILCLSSLANSEMLRHSSIPDVVFDTETKLMWQDNRDTTILSKPWQKAMDYCENLILDGYDDWKLPDRDTLKALYLKKHGLKNVFSYYWSSSLSEKFATSQALDVSSENYYTFPDGGSKNNYNHVRCVRDGAFDSLVFSSLLDLLKKLRLDSNLLALITSENSQLEYFELNGKKYFWAKNSFAEQLNLISKKIDYSKKPYEAIQKLTQELMNPRKPVDITSRIPAEIPKPIIPNEILKPILPTMPVLVKGEFETKAMFEDRVVQTANERQSQINKIQEQYRQDVEARNQTIETLSAEYKEKVKERNQQLALLQKEYDDDILAIAQEQKMKKENPAEYIDIFNKISFLAVMKSVDIKNASYDAETETMYVTVKATNADFEKKASFKVPLADAKEFKENLDKQKVEMAFDYKNSGFVLTNTTFSHMKP